MSTLAKNPSPLNFKAKAQRLSISIILVAMPVCTSAESISVGIGDLLELGFTFESPFAETPDSVQLGVFGLNNYSGNYSASIYDGNRLLGASDFGAGGGIVGSFHSSAFPQLQPQIDFSVIANRSIQGKVSFTPTAGTPLIFEQDLSSSVPSSSLFGGAYKFTESEGSIRSTKVGSPTFNSIYLNGARVWSALSSVGATVQQLFLDFSEAIAPVPPAAVKFFFGEAGAYNKPDAGLTSEVEDNIVSKVNAIFSKFNVFATKTRPTGEYSTIYVGGSIQDVGEPFSARVNPNYVGIAESIDFGNSSKTDIAHVFSEAILTKAPANFADAVAITIAHEASHIMGLRHVLPPTELMNASTSGFDITDACLSLAVSGCQNSFQELGRNVGFKDGSTPQSRSVLEALQLILLRGTYTLGDLFLFNTKIGLYFGDEAGVDLIDIGTLNLSAGSELQLEIPRDAKFALLGSSVEGGVLDTLITSSQFDEITKPESFFQLTNADIFSSATQFLSQDLNVYNYTADSFTKSGVKLSVSKPSEVNEPASVYLIVFGLLSALMVSWRSRRGVLARTRNEAPSKT